MKNIIIILILLILVIIAGAYFFLSQNQAGDTGGTQDQDMGSVTPPPPTPQQPAPTEEPSDEPETVIGTSVQGRSITAYHYGTGDTELLFVGGIHGGYEWNTVLLTYQIMDHFEANPSVIPDNVKVTVIPVLNPDGLQKIVGTAGRFTQADVPSSLEATIPGRFNANNVDLNRNFDCDWKATGVWQNRQVSGGSRAFSEPESQALRDYITASNPKAVVMWYSAAGGVFASNCHNGVLPETLEITNVYADASGYRAYEDFDFYQITGDAINWMAKNNIPAISVLLTTHQDIEWNKNRAGIEALLSHYAE